MTRVVCMMALVLCIVAGEARAEWSSGKGEYTFSREMSEQDACQRAKRRAQEKAVVAVTGERLFSEEMLSCSERNDTASCELSRHTWSVIDGKIQGIRNKAEKTTDLVIGTGTRKCVVSLEADVNVGIGLPDPSFDMTVTINRLIFRHKELLTISVEPTQAMYLTVFQWLPYEKKTAQQIQKLFPNVHDLQNHHQGRIVIPTQQRTEPYEMEVRFPDTLRQNDKFIDEFLMIVGTRENVTFRNSYSLREYQSRLLELPRNQWRQVKRAYTVIKAE